MSKTPDTLDKSTPSEYPNTRYDCLFDKVIVVLLEANPRLPLEDIIQKAHRFVRLALTTPKKETPT